MRDVGIPFARGKHGFNKSDVRGVQRDILVRHKVRLVAFGAPYVGREVGTVLADRQPAVGVVVGIDGNLFRKVGKKERGNVGSVTRSRLRLDALCDKGAVWLTIGVGEGAVVLKLRNVVAAGVAEAAVGRKVLQTAARGDGR